MAASRSRRAEPDLAETNGMANDGAYIPESASSVRLAARATSLAQGRFL